MILKLKMKSNLWAIMRFSSQQHAQGEVESASEAVRHACCVLSGAWLLSHPCTHSVSSFHHAVGYERSTC